MMRHSVISAICVLYLILGLSKGAPPSWGYFPQSGPAHWNRFPCSRRQNEPCDKAVRSLSSGDTHAQEFATCECRNGNCPSGYSTDGPQTLSYRDTDSRISISLHYCQPLRFERDTCSDGEVAVVVEGGMIPENIQSLRCKCPPGASMQVKKSYYEGWMNVKELVCSLPECNANTSNGQTNCQHLTRSRTDWRYTMTNLCNCPDGQVCRRPNTMGNEFFKQCQAIRNL